MLAWMAKVRKWKNRRLCHPERSRGMTSLFAALTELTGVLAWFAFCLRHGKTRFPYSDGFRGR